MEEIHKARQCRRAQSSHVHSISPISLKLHMLPTWKLSDSHPFWVFWRLHYIGQRRQPTRLPRPWDSPGKNTGVGCHFLLQCMKVKSESEVTQWCLTLRDPMDCSPPGSSVHGIFQARVLEWGAMPLPSPHIEL